MRRALPFLAIAITLLGLAASAASLADSLAPAPAWCSAGGCATVRASAWAKPLGIPLPFVGVGFFSALLALSLLDVTRARRALAIAGAVGALGLISLQAFVIGAWCKLCLVADLSALSLGVLALVWRSWSPLPRAPVFGAFALGALAIAAPLALTDTSAPKPPGPVAGAPLPEVVSREQHRGEVTIVDFIDFECPFCRMLHGRLNAAIDQTTKAGARVRVVRKMVPLVDKHPGALPAAIAWCCAEKQGKADAMAEALVAAPTEQLTTEGCEKLASQIGCDMDRYRHDAADPATKARIDHDIADARAAGVKSLPTVYIGATAFVGAAASTEQLVAAIH
jgi:uncharacterized membrane protein/protein-disulfide isomerase